MLKSLHVPVVATVHCFVVVPELDVADFVPDVVAVAVSALVVLTDLFDFVLVFVVEVDETAAIAAP